MRHHAAKSVPRIVLASLVLANPSFASEIFHWVDEDGVLNFSDWAPADNTVEVTKLVVSDSNPPGYDPNEDKNSILDQAERMNVRWEELKERQEARRKRRGEVEQRQQLPQYVEYDYPYYYGSRYFFQLVRPPGFGQRPPFRTPKRQFAALDHLGLTGPRPHSINSSAHLARINAGKTFKANFQPRRPGMGHRPSTFGEW